MRARVIVAAASEVYPGGGEREGEREREREGWVGREGW